MTEEKCPYERRTLCKHPEGEIRCTMYPRDMRSKPYCMYQDGVKAGAESRQAEIDKKDKRIVELENMLEDVINTLDLSDYAVNKYGSSGTPPAEIVGKVIKEKDMVIIGLKSGIDVGCFLTKERIT